MPPPRIIILDRFRIRVIFKCQGSGELRTELSFEDHHNVWTNFRDGHHAGVTLGSSLEKLMSGPDHGGFPTCPGAFSDADFDVTCGKVSLPVDQVQHMASLGRLIVQARPYSF